MGIGVLGLALMDPSLTLMVEGFGPGDLDIGVEV